MLDVSLGNWWIWYEKVWAAVYLVPSDTKVLEIYLLKNIKIHDELLYDKLEFLSEPYMILRLGKPFTHICYLVCIEFSQALLMPYERFVMLLKSRSRTHPLGVGDTICHSIKICPKKYFTPTLKVNTYNTPYRIYPK
jgi:hypothetical protein